MNLDMHKKIIHSLISIFSYIMKMLKKYDLINSLSILTFSKFLILYLKYKFHSDKIILIEIK